MGAVKEYAIIHANLGTVEQLVRNAKIDCLALNVASMKQNVNQAIEILKSL